EELRRGYALSLERREDLRNAGADRRVRLGRGGGVKLPGEQDATVDREAIEVRRERHIGARLRRDPRAQVHGCLLAKIRDAKRLRHPALVVAREDAIENQVAAGVDGELI